MGKWPYKSISANLYGTIWCTQAVLSVCYAIL